MKNIKNVCMNGWKGHCLMLYNVMSMVIRDTQCTHMTLKDVLVCVHVLPVHIHAAECLKEIGCYTKLCIMCSTCNISNQVKTVNNSEII